MFPALHTIGIYLARIAPGIALGVVLLVLLRRQPRLRIVIYLALFVLLRDAMTPLGLWSFGRQGFFWIRLHDDPLFLLFSGITSLAVSLGLYFCDHENRPLVQWTRGRTTAGLLLGLAGAVVIVSPLALLYQSAPLSARGGPVATHLIPAILWFALSGNLFEELLFRGYVYGWLAATRAPIRAGVASGVVFAFCHIYLATTVTDIGYPLLLFTLWEGTIAGVIGAKSGVAASTLAHGGAIFLLSAGLI